MFVKRSTTKITKVQVGKTLNRCIYCNKVIIINSPDEELICPECKRKQEQLEKTENES